MSSVKSKILIVEDEKHIAEGLKLNLNLQGHEAEIASDGEKALTLLKEQSWDLVLLDLMLPIIPGEKIIRKIRSIDDRLPILVLSAKDQSVEKVKCLELGVDDYQTKPFDLDELLLRVKRLLQRNDWLNEDQNKKSSTYVFGPNKVDLIGGVAETANGELKLTLQEVRVLKLFFDNPGAPLSRDELLKKGWGMENVMSRTVDNFIVRLRKYFGRDEEGQKEYFQSIRGVGYQYNAPANSGFSDSSEN
ncbi:MAG: response regulator transcription factor [Bacteriovoracaceae bacterium]